MSSAARGSGTSAVGDSGSAGAPRDLGPDWPVPSGGGPDTPVLYLPSVLSLPRAPSLLLVVAAGCMSATEHREKADRSAASIIGDDQRGVYGHAEPFTIDRPSGTFRQKLFEAQGLPHTGTESYTATKLEPVPHWPEEGYPYGKLPPEEVEAPWEGTGPYVMSLTDALKI